jgi:hypothetical protein
MTAQQIIDQLREIMQRDLLKRDNPIRSEDWNRGYDACLKYLINSLDVLESKQVQEPKKESN